MKYIFTITVILFVAMFASSTAQAIGPFKCEIDPVPVTSCAVPSVRCQSGFATESACDTFLVSQQGVCTVLTACGGTITPPVISGSTKYCFENDGALSPIIGCPYCTAKDCNDARDACRDKDGCEVKSSCYEVNDGRSCNQYSGSVSTPAATQTYTPPSSYRIEKRINNPLQSASLEDLLTKLVRGIMIVVVPFLVLIIVYSGFMFVSGARSEDGLKKAKKNALYATIGIVVILGANILISIAKSLLDIFSTI